MIAGITSLVVFSYKIFRSRVYPVGMVRKIPPSQEYLDEPSVGLRFETSIHSDLMSLLHQGWSVTEIARDLNLSEQDIKNYIQRVRNWEVHAKGRGLQSGWRQYRLVLRHNLEQNPSREGKDSTLEELLRTIRTAEEIVEHGEALKIHSKQFEEIEKRIRRLEIESVQKLQEATEEKPQPPQVVN
jgi:hypothetical protein